MTLSVEKDSCVQGPVCSDEMKSYFSSLNEECERCYSVAGKARARGLDPETKVEIPPAADLASRVENLVGPENIAEKIREFTKRGDSREMVAILIAKYIVETFDFPSKDKAIEQGVRTGLAIITEGVLVAPLEGVSDVSVRQNDDGSDYLRLSFAGPIRSAGGTGQAVGVLIADVVRREMGISEFKVRNDEIERYKEEFHLRKASQYKPKDEEIENIARNCPICIDGDGTEKREVSGYRNLDRIETNQVRGGMCLVIAEGLCQKAKKIKKLVDALGIEGWDFISKLIKEESDDSGKMSTGIYDFEPDPKVKYLRDVIAGRPVFSMPCAIGGFRLRYGRGRTCGLAAIAIHPATMYVLNEFLAIGTQIKIEYPGKAGAITPCNTIEGPMVELFNGDLVAVNSVEAAVDLKRKVARIIDLGEILIPFGEFAENNHPLLPPSFANEWWTQLLERELTKMNHSPMEMEPDEARELADALLSTNFTNSFLLSQHFQIPLNPSFNLFYHDIPPEVLHFLGSFLARRGRMEGDLDTGAGEDPVIDTEILHDMKMDTGEKLRLVIPRDYDDDDNDDGNNDNDNDNDNDDGDNDDGDNDDGDNDNDNEWKAAKEILCTLGAQHEIVDGKMILEKYGEALVRCLGLTIEDKGVISKPDNWNSSFQELDVVPDDEACAVEWSSNRSIKYEDENHYLKHHDNRYRGDSLRLLQRISGIDIYPRAPTRVGTRMARPEKASERKMKPPVHSLFPLGAGGGDRRSMKNANEVRRFSVEMGTRKCPKCFKKTHTYLCPVCSEHTERESNIFLEEREVDFYSLYGEAMRNIGMGAPPETKGVKGLISKFKTPEPIEKGLLRAKNDVFMFKDGTIRFDMTDVPLTHFRPREIHTPVDRLRELGYVHDTDGNELERDDQLVELKVQDIIGSRNCISYFYKATRFIDELLVRFYKLDSFYNLKKPGDLIGQLVVGLAPHTSGGVLARIIGFVDARVGYAHPFFHAAKRRNCDGDEDCIMLLLDGLINFSKTYLPGTIGGQMDAPLVLSTRLDPSEIDKESHNIDCHKRYPLEFFEAAVRQESPKMVDDIMDKVAGRIDSCEQYEKFGFTHDTNDISEGVTTTAYKRLASMDAKVEGQLKLATMIRAVNDSFVAAKVIESHFMPDMIGNMNAFSRQKMKCRGCGMSFRRPPLGKVCLKCGNEINLTVHRGNVEKYINTSKKIAERYDLPEYTKQRIELIESALSSLFNNDKVKQTGLWDFC